MLLDLRYLAGKSDTQISPGKAFDFFSIPKHKPAYQSHEEPSLFEAESVKTALATEAAAPSDDEDESESFNFWQNLGHELLWFLQQKT